MPSCSKHPPSPSVAATLRLAKARLRWRRAADDLLVGAIFDELNIVRRDGDCFGRTARQAALMPALAPALAPKRNTGARQAPAPVF